MGLTVRVRQVRREAIDVTSYELVHADGGRLPSFSPGAHIDLNLGEGMVRQYSICNDGESPESYLIAVKLEADSRGGSRLIHETFRRNDLVPISIPRNSFALVPTAKRSVLLGAGIGITPLLSMATRLARDQQAFSLYYFARSMEHAAFADSVSTGELRERSALYLGLDAAGVDRSLAEILSSEDEETHVYVCGPAPFIALAREHAQRFALNRFHHELFTALPAEDSAVEQPFSVRLARSGGTYEVQPGVSIVETLLDQGLDIPFSCNNGLCGTCLTGVLEGTPDHRDQYLTEERRASGTVMCPCVSRSKSPVLVLDL